MRPSRPADGETTTAADVPAAQNDRDHEEEAQGGGVFRRRLPPTPGTNGGEKHASAEEPLRVDRYKSFRRADRSQERLPADPELTALFGVVGDLELTSSATPPRDAVRRAPLLVLAIAIASYSLSFTWRQAPGLRRIPEVATPRAKRAGPTERMHCPVEPAGHAGSRRDVDPGSPALFLISHDAGNPDLRGIWRRDLFPHMAGLNFDAVFLVESSQRGDVPARELEDHGDIAFYDVPHYSDRLWGFYYRAIEGYRYGLYNHSTTKEYEWFIRPDMDAFYCLHHIRLELNDLEARERPGTKPGLHWAHFYGDGAGGQNGPPVSDVHETLNRFAAEEALKYAREAMHDGIWDLARVEVYGSNVADLSPNVTQVHDVRWAYGPGTKGETFWNSGFLSWDVMGDQECLCANWLAIHLGKTDLNARFSRLAELANMTQRKEIHFDQDRIPPVGTKLGWSLPYFGVGGCKGKKKDWPGCDS